MHFNREIVISIAMVISVIFSFLSGYQFHKFIVCKKCKERNGERKESNGDGNDGSPLPPSEFYNVF